MGKIFCVAKREFRETAKTKFFIFSVFFTPLLIVGTMALVRYTSEKAVSGPHPPKNIAVVDLSGQLDQDIQRAFERYNSENPERRLHTENIAREANEDDDVLTERIKSGVREDAWDGALVVGKHIIEGDGGSYYYSKTRNMGDVGLLNIVKSLHQKAITNFRFRAHDLSPELIAELSEDATLVPVDLSAENEQQGMQFSRLMTPFFFLFLMFMGIFGTSQGMLTSVIEEKNSRVVEVLLSSITPFQLMAGKILGLVALGFSIMSVWGIVAYGAALRHHVSDLFNVAGVGYFLIFFVLGFLLFSSLFAAVGAMCNSTKEAQAMMMPLMIVVVMPMMLWPYIAQYPNGLLALVLSLVPVTSPMVMILRITALPELPVWQIAVSLAVLAASVPAAMWVGAKVFRTGILMYGKPPSLREVWRWLQAS